MNTQNSNRENKRKKSLSVLEIVLFSMFGTLMFCSKILMEALPNIHLLGMLTIVYTLVLGKKALVPIYVYVLLNGLYGGFSLWWMPYLYIWTILWGIIMILPKNIPKKLTYVVYPVICGLHGFAFGVLYAPAQALMFNLDAQQLSAWIVAGLPFDAIHGVGNLVAGLLIVPISDFLKKLLTRSRMYTQ